jgi:hypothetical protein
MTRAARSALFTLLALAGSAAAAATPCEAPEQFVRQPKIAVDTTPVDALPLLRPYVLAGLPVVALREEGGQRWLELAVFSADDARRQPGDPCPRREGLATVSRGRLRHLSPARASIRLAAFGPWRPDCRDDRSADLASADRADPSPRTRPA